MLRNVLIVHAGALGDHVLTWPLAMALARLYAQSRLFYITHKQKGDLAQRALRVESADIENGWHGLFGDGSIPDAARSLIEGSHLIVTFIAQAGEAWSENIRKLNSQAALVHIAPRPPVGYAQHASSYLLQQLSEQRAIHDATEQILRSVGHRGIGGRRKIGSGVVLHPGSGSHGKCWPRERFCELARLLRSRGVQVKVILGEVEMERWPAESIEMFEDVAAVVRPASYVELMQHIESAALFIGNDSGPGHLAGIMGIPTISIFGPASDPRVWHPLGPSIHVIHAPAMEQIDVTDIEKRTTDLLQ